MSTSPPGAIAHDEMEARLAEYVDGALPATDAQEVELHIETCSECKEAVAALRDTVNALSGLHRLQAPRNFDREVAETIRRRSGGRFFAGGRFADRVPIQLLVLVVLALGVALTFFLWRSETGSLRPF